MPIVLRYFDIGGLAEYIRYILHYTNQKFEDVRYELKTWPNKDIKDGLPYGQLPVLEDGNKVLNQSIAIAKYCAANTELLPSDAWEQAQLDAIVFTVFDFHKHIYNFIFAKTKEEKTEMKKKLYDEFIDYYFSRFEKKLIENNGYFGGKLSWADFVVIGIIENANLFLEDNIQKDYPAISKLFATIQGLPRIKEYIKTRKPYEPFTKVEN